MLLKSLLCFRGYDNGLRLLVVSFFVYFAMLLASSLNLSFGLLVGTFAIVLLGLASYRRMRDVSNSYWMMLLAVIPAGCFLLLLNLEASLIILIFNALVGFALIGFLAGLKTLGARKYTYGYFGPALDEVQVRTNSKARVEPNVRIEPMLSNHDAFTASDNLAKESDSFTKKSEFNPSSEGETEARQAQVTIDGQVSRRLGVWSDFVIKRRVILLSSAGLMLGVCLVISFWPKSISISDSNDISLNNRELDKPLNRVERVQVKLPDGFALVLEQQETKPQSSVLIMRWLGDSGAADMLWSLAKAQGDKRCANLTFNDGTQYRPMEVNLLADSATEARFTPLDTEKIIKDMARRGSVKLCGYNFSLKGSQAVLGRELKFANILGS